jgi:hypothetical protein
LLLPEYGGYVVLGDIYYLKVHLCWADVSARMFLNFQRIPASGEYRLKANNRRIHLLAFHSFVAPLSATLWKILWIGGIVHRRDAEAGE